MRSAAKAPSTPGNVPPAPGQATRPLFAIDPGWLFILAGLALCVAGVLIPAQKDLFHLRAQLESLRERERLSSERLRHHAQFLADLDEADPSLTRRLAASQLNIVPAGDVPVILAASSDAALTDWIDARAAQISADRPPRQKDWPDSTFAAIATGPQRLWLLGGGVLAVFVGLMLGPGRSFTAEDTQSAEKKHLILASALSAVRCRLQARREPAMNENAIEDEAEEVLCEIVIASEFALTADESDLGEAAESLESVDHRITPV